jgi:hypothetical protein
MNRRLSESRIRSTCRELLKKNARLSGRGLCAELRTRFGAVGKTERVFAIWREEGAAKAAPVTAPIVFPPDVAELHRRLAAAESAAAQNLARAELAELREQAHQERWAMEIDRLRQELMAQRTSAADVRRMQEQVMQLSRELMEARA